jgi:hypothetical protein
MTNKLVITLNSLNTKNKKILLYEMKFLVQNYSCLQNPWLGGCHPQIPVLSVLCPQLNLLNPPPPHRKKFMGTPLIFPILPTGRALNILNRYKWITSGIHSVPLLQKSLKMNCPVPRITLFFIDRCKIESCKQAGPNVITNFSACHRATLSIIRQKF